MKRSISRYLAMLLALVLLITPLTNVKGVSAVMYSPAEYNDIVNSLINNLETYETNFNSVQERQGIYTQLYQARQIFHYATFLYSAAYSARLDKDYRERLGGSLGTIAINLSNMIVKYNTSYFVGDNEYLGVKIDQQGDTEIKLEELQSASDAEIEKACSYLESWCIKIARQYLVETLEEYAKSVKLDNTEDTQEEYGSLCSEIYKGLKYGLTCISDAESLMGIQNDTGLNMGSFAFTKSTVETRIKNDIEKYSEIFSIGQVSVAIDKNLENAINIDPTKTVLENMADVYIEQDESNPNYGLISIEKEPSLSLAYIGALASSATYTPFESYVGDTRFMAALDSLCNDQETATLLNSYYNSLKLYKKPLYFRSLNSVGNPDGQAELKSISEIFDLISSGATGSLCTVNGNLCVNTNTGDWVYTTEQLDSSTLYSLKSALKESEQVESTLGDIGDVGEEAETEVTGTATVEEAAQKIYAAFHEKGYTDESICGILGNIQQESNFKADAERKGEDGNIAHVGLAQWGSSFDGVFNNWSSYKGNLDHQITYLISTLETGGYKNVGTNLKGMTDVNAASIYFCAEYERCTVSGSPGAEDEEYNGKYYQHLKKRKAYAQDFYKNIDKLKGTTTAKVENNALESVLGMFGIKTAYASPTTPDDTTGNTETEENTPTEPVIVDIQGEITNVVPVTGEDPEAELGEDVPDVDGTGDTAEDNTATQDSADKVITDYSDQKKDFKDAISAARIISDESRLNGPVLLFGSVYQRDVDNMTTAIYSNVLNSAGNYNIENMDSEYLYINAFGDIVTASDLVVFPGILNPILYADNVAYNPYSVAFMNSYPANIRNSAYYMLSSKSDVGKYCLFLDTPESNEVPAIQGYNNDEDDSYYLTDGNYEFALLNSTTGVKSTQTLLSKPIFNKFIYGDFEKSPTFRLQKYLFCHNINRKKDANTYIPLIENASIYANNKQVFPYDYTADTDSSVSKVIANNMYQYLTTDFMTKEIGNQKKLHDNWILHYILISGFEGTADISSYKNNIDISYDGYTMSNSSRVISHIVEFSEKLIKSISSVNCVLGLQNAYEDVLLGKIVTLIRNYWLIFYIVFLFVVLVAVMRAKKDLLQSAFLIIACSVAAFAFVYLVPVYLPMLYNLAVNNVSDRVAYEVLLQSNEYNAGTADNIVDIDEDGKLKYNTSSITLYRLPSAQLEAYYDNLGITLNDATGGKSFILDQYSGFFLEGDSLKVSTDVLFGTLSIKEDPSTGELHAYKTTSNNVDYYIPYYQIVDSLVDKLNRVMNVYDVNHSTTKLKNGSRANNFRAYTYFNSPIFINPDNVSADLQLDTEAWTEEEVEEYTEKQQKIANALVAEFGDNTDWLGLYDIFVTNTLREGSNYQNTLWFKTMCDVGYYRSTPDGWVADEDNINALITYINYQARNFVYDIRDYVGDISDESIVEIVALRAVVAMTQEASDFTHWMYPFSVNYPEFSLGDVAISTFVEKYSDYVKNNYSIVSYMNDKYGWFNLLVFDMVSILLFVVTWLVKILSSVFYVLLLVVLIIRMFGDGQYAVVVKGFLKCSTVIMTILLLQVMSIALGSKLVGNVIGIYVVLAFSVLALYLLVIVITSIMFNFADFGNSALNAKVSGVTNSIQSLRNISVNTTNLQKIMPEHNPAIVLPQERLSRYDFDADTDDQYDDMIQSDYQETTVVNGDAELDFYEDSDDVDTTEYDF